MSLDYLPDFDVILVDTIGMPFIGSTAIYNGMGGSEFEQILLLEELVKNGKSVMSINNTPVAAFEKGVHYYPKDVLKFQNFKCKTLIVERTTPVPTNIEFEKLLIWATDMPNDTYSVHGPWFNNPKATLVSVSDWHGSLFANIQNKKTIYNMIPDSVYDMKVAKNFNKFIYTSAGIKGLNETVEFFKEIKKNYFFKKTELLVLNPGYDKVDVELLKKNKINFGGTLPFGNVLMETANSGVLFYVNKMPETFGISVVLAEILGCAPFVLCLNGFGALKEVSNSPYITNNVDEFQKNLIEFTKKQNSYKNPAQDFRSSKIIKDWLAVI